MAASHLPILLVTIFLSLLCLQNFPSQTNADSPNPSQLLIDVCNRTINVTFCLDTLESDPKSSKASDALKLAEATIGLALKNAKESKKHMDSLLISRNTRPDYKPAIKECSVLYESMVKTFSGAFEEIKVDPMTASYDLGVTYDRISMCNYSMVDHGANIESIVARNKISQCYTSITTAVTNML